MGFRLRYITAAIIFLCSVFTVSGQQTRPLKRVMERDTVAGAIMHEPPQRQTTPPAPPVAPVRDTSAVETAEKKDSVAVTARQRTSKQPAATEHEDSVVYLLSGKSAQIIEKDDVTYRKVVGPARFLHNNTYLLCDTALWNVDAKIIDAIGNVSIIQDNTVLTSDKMKYLIDSNLAQFRGSQVQLSDKDHNTLRTRHLDYNTKDSVAVFRNGGSMMDKDGQIIESLTGTYDSKIKVFRFMTDVNMFTDSIFIKTNTLKYESEISLATFGSGTNAWKENNMLSSEAGWYDREKETFFFNRNVHMMSENQEAWGDSLYFYRNTSDVILLGNTQLTDTTRQVHSLSGKVEYIDSISRVTLTRNPAVVAETEENGTRDTVYIGADIMYYYTKRMCDIDSVTVAEAVLRKSNLDIDPVREFRRKAAEEAAKKAAEEAALDPNRPPVLPRQETSGDVAPETPADAQTEIQDKTTSGGPDTQADVPSEIHDVSDVPDDGRKVAGEQADSLTVSDLSGLTDSLAVTDSLSLSDPLSVTDSLALADSVAAIEPDTTKIGFAVALHNVRIFRKSMQIVCDSLLYSDLDSLARFFKEPVIWNEVTQQYSADSVTAVIKNNGMDKVSLMSNAFVHMEEDTLHYNQIRGAEMLAYFSPEGELQRFDALGGASALFYIEENDTLATVNTKDSKMLSAVFKDGDLNKIYYFDTAVSDAYPVVQMSREDQRLKGFNWLPERRPVDKNAVTERELRPSQRSLYNARPRARFVETDRYFPGYIDDIYVQIAVRDSLNHVREKERQREEKAEAERQERLKDSLELARLDSLAAVKADSIAVADSLKAVADSIAIADSIARADSIAALNDPDRILTKEEIKAKKKAEREQQKQARIERREARWAAKDASDAEKAKAKADKKAAALERKKRKVIQQAADRARKEAEILQKYIERYQKRLDRKTGRK